MSFVVATSLATIAGVSSAQSLPMLDGETTTPTHAETTYSFECLAGSSTGAYRLVLIRDRTGHVRSEVLVRHGLPIPALETAKLDSALSRFLYVDSVTPRCSISGGATLLFGGGDRLQQSGIKSRSAFRAAISPAGTITIEP